MKKTKDVEADDLRPEYHREDLGKGVRGKYLAAYQKGSNLVLLRPEIAKAFPTSEAVNEALQGLLQLIQQTHKLARRYSGSTRRTAVSGMQLLEETRPTILRQEQRACGRCPLTKE